MLPRATESDVAGR